VTARDKKVFGNYVREIANLVGLCNWHIQVQFGELDTPDWAEEVHPDEEWGAQNEQIPHRKVALLTFPGNVKERDRDDLRGTVVHELVHCHFAAMWHQVRKDLLKQLGQQGYDIFVNSFERNMEWGVDGVASAWAEKLPLITWPK
jgi:hypothetical protein